MRAVKKRLPGSTGAGSAVRSGGGGKCSEEMTSGQGLSYWLVGVLVLAAVASALPAWRAVRLTVRDVLAYE